MNNHGKIAIVIMTLFCFLSLQTSFAAIHSTDSTNPGANEALANVAVIDDAKAMNTAKSVSSQRQIGAELNNDKTGLSPYIPPFVGNYEAIQTAIDSAAALNASHYPFPTSWNLFQTALNKAQAMNNNKNAYSQAEIDELVTNLNTAKMNLILISPPVMTYHGLNDAINAVTGLSSKNYSPASWNALVIAHRNGRNLNTAKNANNQSQIYQVTNALSNAQSKLKKRNADLTITKVTRSGNSYRITVRNRGKDPSTATRLSIYTTNKKYQKLANVKAIGAGKSITVTVKFFTYSVTRRFNKNIDVNHDKRAMETNYKNNRFKISKT